MKMLLLLAFFTACCAEICANKLPFPATLSKEVSQYADIMTNNPIAVVNVRLIDPSVGTTRENQTIVIQQGYILGFGDARIFPVPPNTQIISGLGKTIIPGLIGMHQHFFNVGRSPIYNPQSYSAPKLYLARGVTTVRTAGTLSPYADLNLKVLIDNGAEVGPRMFVTGPYIEGNPGATFQAPWLKDVNQTIETVLYWSRMGAVNFKAYMMLPKAQLKAAIDTAHSVGKKLTAHLCAVTFREAASMGIDNLEHGLLVSTDFVPNKQPDVCPGETYLLSLVNLDINSPPVISLIDFLVSKNVAITSTLAVFEGFAPDSPNDGPDVLKTMLPEAAAAYLEIRQQIIASNQTMWSVLIKKEMEFERLFVARGGHLMAGADPTGIGGVVPGYADARNLEMLVQAGFTPIEALKIYSWNAAQYLGIDDCVGSIQKGLRADLLLLNGNPSLDIRATQAIELVFKDGIGFNPTTILKQVEGTVSWV